MGDALWGSRYPRTLARAKIALGLLSKRIPETTTTRTFEIPAAAAFMLAERTNDHLALFEEGIEADFFTSDEELREKIQFYLTHDTVRTKIAAAGRRRCVKSGYHSEKQLRNVLSHLA
jgi:spore maturation protein CgeB